MTGYTTWDENYFYAAFTVDDPDITGTNISPFSNPWEDDSVEIFLETDNNHAPGRSKSTYHMAVSSAGGAAFTESDGNGGWRIKKILSFKYASVADGSISNSNDLDIGYTVELALPWHELGVKAPTPGTMMSFNVVVRMRGETNKFVSLSPAVKTEEDIHDASKWANIVFTGAGFAVATTSLDKIVSAKYIARMPLIDGQVRQKEWNNNTSFELPLPIEKQKLPQHQLQKMVLTHYFYWYQDNPRKAAPCKFVRAAGGVLELSDSPANGAGPWFSYDRVQLHKTEFSDMKRAGVDIVMPVYRGDAASRAAYAAKGLDSIAEALRELKSEKKPYPLVGMFFDTSSMALAYKDSSQPKGTEDVKRTFYGMIHDFFMRVPEEFRAQVQMSDERKDRPCCIVYLYSCKPISGFDASFISYANEQFVKDFGAHILWMGAQDFKDKQTSFDAYCNYGAGLGSGYDDTARIRVSTIGPGYDDCAIAVREAHINARNAGDLYKTEWTEALNKRPNWVVLDGWNNLSEGTGICGTRQYGFTYVDTTAIQTLKFRGAREYDAKYMHNNLPAVITTGAFYQTDITVQNDGTKPWKAAEGYALGYRWYQNGALVAESGIRRPVQSDVFPGHSANITIGIAAVTKDGQNLPEGDYDVRFEMVRLADDKWFSALGDDGFVVPVRVGKNSDVQARFLSIDGPVMMKTGAGYPFKVVVRNDGASTWKAGWTLGCRLFKVSNGAREEVGIAPVNAGLEKDVPPGETAEVTVNVNLKDTAGQPLPVWKQTDPWSYLLKFDIFDGSKSITEESTASNERIIDVFENDYGAKVIACDVSDGIEAGKTITCKVVVKNDGTDTWTKETYSIGCHWYYLDGVEAVWDGEKTPVNGQIVPGMPAIINAKLTAPPYDGRYILVWDFFINGKWASTSEISRGNDILTTEVTVKNGKLQFADLSKLFDVAGASPDRNRESGGFDGSGHSFPAEMIPPDTSMGKPNDIYPCCYGWKSDPAGLESPRHISFVYGPKAAGDKNFIACAGQSVAVPKAKYTKIHILGAAIEPDQEADFGLGYQSSVEPAKVVMSSWTGEPMHGEEIGLVTLHRHSKAGDEPGVKCYLFHYTIQVDPAKPLASIVLPKNDKVRITAITLEKP
ncbi:MAG: sugar-binding protein [Armatimonadota bacterium]